MPDPNELQPAMPDNPPAKEGDDRKPTAQTFLLEIEQAEKDAQRYLRRARKVVKIYTEQIRDETRTDRQYALLWANTQVLQPAVYARPPQPVVSRRFNDQDPTGRAVAEVLQRALTSVFERENIDVTMRNVRDDFLLVARGTAWVRYTAAFGSQDFGVGPENADIVEVTTDESLAYDFVNWADFLYPKSTRWSEVPWVARRVYLDKNAFIARFGEEKYRKVAQKTQDGVATRFDTNKDKPKDRTVVYELWSKRDNCVVWLTKSCQEFLDHQPPLYNLQGFYPCPEPAWGTRSTDSLTPIPDYIFYQDQAEEINTLTAKIGGLQDALKLTGFYPAGAEGEISAAIERAAAPSASNQMIPVPAWSQFVAGGGAKQMIEWWPAEMVIKVLQGCIELRKQLIEDVYQITGISDIIRGNTEASETATAQNLKAQWGGIRIRDRQQEIARFARDLARISAEIISEKFQPETIWRMTGLKYPTQAEKDKAKQLVQQMMLQAQQQAAQAQQPGPDGQPQPAPQGPPPEPEIPPELANILKSPTQEEILTVIRDDQTRSYRVDIETDSTIAADEKADQEARTQFVQVVGGFMQQAMPLVEAAPELTELAGEFLLFVARGFRGGRQLEETIEGAIQKLETKAATALKAPPPPNPELMKVEIQAKTSEQEMALRTKETELKAVDTQERLVMDRERLALEKDRHIREQDRNQLDDILKVAGHNKQVITEKKELATKEQEAEMAGPTVVEQIGRNLEALANQMMLNQENVLNGQMQIAQAMQAFSADSRRAEAEEAARTAELQNAIAGLAEGQAALLAVLQAPKRIVRGADGRAKGVEVATTLN